MEEGVPWTDFKNLYGDWGRDLALYVGRVLCGWTLRELGEQVGLMNADSFKGRFTYWEKAAS